MLLNDGQKTLLSSISSIVKLKFVIESISSVAQSCLTLRPHGMQHTRLPCPSPTLGACSNSSPLSWWCHPTISSSVFPFSSCLQSLPASGSFPVSQFFTSGGQIIGASASASVPPMNIHSWFPLGGTGLIVLLISQQSSPTPQFKTSIFWCSTFFIVELSHPYRITG